MIIQPMSTYIFVLFVNKNSLIRQVLANYVIIIGKATNVLIIIVIRTNLVAPKNFNGLVVIIAFVWLVWMLVGKKGITMLLFVNCVF
mmetsp:Transcript_17257/g.34332  ORF Transcript_17257/g.34332 Transcript_17257/m.34332 type:complete len:87 (-) Transcript_17257:205-465(-)